MSAGRALARALAAAAAMSAAVGCGPGEARISNAVPPPAPPVDRTVLVTLGGDETGDRPGTGSLTRTWEQLVFASLPASSVLVDLSEHRPTARAVLRDQVPRAVALHPTVAVVWVGAGDYDSATSETAFTTDLRAVVAALQGAGARRVLLLGRPTGRLSAAVDAVAVDTGARVVPLPAEAEPGQETVAAAVRPYLAR
jgi:hypothetical protein